MTTSPSSATTATTSSRGSLDEEWAAYDTKAMHLTYADGAHGVRIFGGTRVALPVVTVPGKVGISLYAGDISTSREALITAKPSGRHGL